MNARAGILLLFCTLILAACRFDLPTTIESVPLGQIPAAKQTATGNVPATPVSATAASQPTKTATQPAPVEPTATPIPALDPQAEAIVAEAMAEMAGAGTFHYAMSRQLANDPSAPDLLLHIPVSGKYHAPDRVQGSITFSSAMETAAFDFIIIGDDLYLSEPSGGQWQQLSEHEAVAQLIRENALLPLAHLSADNLHDSVLVADVLLAGVPLYHVRSKVGKIAAEGQPSASTNSIDLWIGREDHYIHRAVLQTAAAGEEGAAGSGSSTTQVDYTGFGKPVMIVAPLAPEPSVYRPVDSYPMAVPQEESPERANLDIFAD